MRAEMRAISEPEKKPFAMIATTTSTISIQTLSIVSTFSSTPTVDQDQDQEQGDHADHYQPKAEQHAFVTVHSSGTPFRVRAAMRVDADPRRHRVRASWSGADREELVVFGGGGRRRLGRGVPSQGSLGHDER